jgi:hypothetical protein
VEAHAQGVVAVRRSGRWLLSEQVLDRRETGWPIDK